MGGAKGETEAWANIRGGCVVFVAVVRSGVVEAAEGVEARGRDICERGGGSTCVVGGIGGLRGHGCGVYSGGIEAGHGVVVGLVDGSLVLDAGDPIFRVKVRVYAPVVLEEAGKVAGNYIGAGVAMV